MAWEIDVRRESSLTIADGPFYIATLMDKPGWGNMETNARLIIAARNSYDKHCGERAVECAEDDLLGALLAALQAIAEEGDPDTATQDWPDPEVFADWATYKAKQALARAD